MIKQEYFLVGVMSGTSLDGIDLAYVHFTKNENWSYKIIFTETVSYNSYWENILKLAVDYDKNSLESLDVEYTHLLASTINTFINKYQLTNIDAVSSHGHTILHQPENKITLQIGNLPILTDLIKRDVVCDFRLQDVRLGGQGAPLVPLGDQLLFSDYSSCINLGGFSNISKDNSNTRIAYDICPVNIVLNHYVQKTGVSYDDKGVLASSGKICDLLLKDLNSLSFYKKTHPKSLGLEWVKSVIFPLIDSYNLTVKDVLRTFVEHVSIQIGKELVSGDANTLFTGGGVYNLFLMSRIKNYSNAKITIPNIDLIEFKEALIFAFLGVLRLRDEINVLASVTGAKSNHSSGKIFISSDR